MKFGRHIHYLCLVLILCMLTWLTKVVNIVYSAPATYLPPKSPVCLQHGVFMYFHFTHLYVSINFLNTADLFAAISLFSSIFLCLFVSVLILVRVCVCRALDSDILRAQCCSQSEDWPSFSPQRGACTERLLDAKWTGNFSSLDAAPENSSFLFLTRIFLLMMCGQPTNLREWETNGCIHFLEIYFGSKSWLWLIHSGLFRHFDFVMLYFFDATLWFIITHCRLLSQHFPGS